MRKIFKVLFTIGVLGTLGSGIYAQAPIGSNSQTYPIFPRCNPCPPPCSIGLEPITPDSTKPVDPNLSQQALPDPGAQAPLAGTGGGIATAIPQSIGDSNGYLSAKRKITVPAIISLFPYGEFNSSTTSGTTQLTLYSPVASRAGSGIKMADDDSPRPLDRVFFTYNNFYNMGGTGPTTIIDSSPTNLVYRLGYGGGYTSYAVPGIPGIIVNRELLGFEKTFLGGDASVEMRLPIFQTSRGYGDAAFAGDAIGDMSVILKYAMINDRETNNVLSAGLMLTLPTGPPIQTTAGNIDSVLFQPFVGYIYNVSVFYLQGFSSLVVPTNPNDVTVLFNDIGMGCFLYRSESPDAPVSSIVPTIETHVTTPLNNRGCGGVVQASDIVSFTGGVHFGIGNRAWLTLGVNTPVTGPRPYDVESIVQFNYLF